ncbi:MAG: DinB family protein [Gemmatimonadota bacterium]
MRFCNLTRAAALASVIAFGLPAAASAQALAEAVTSGLTGRFETVSGHVLSAAEGVPEEQYSYRPTDEVRTLGEMFGHVAVAQFAYCAAISGAELPASARGAATSKADIVQRVSASRDFCIGVYRGTTGEALGGAVSIFGNEDTRVGGLIQNLAHSNLHYGNIVTYMRALGLVPPSSE